MVYGFIQDEGDVGVEQIDFKLKQEAVNMSANILVENGMNRNSDQSFRSSGGAGGFSSNVGGAFNMPNNGTGEIESTKRSLLCFRILFAAAMVVILILVIVVGVENHRISNIEEDR